MTQLRAMIAEFTNADYQAELHFYWWQMTGDEGVRQTAVQLYEVLLPRMPNYKLQQQLKKLRAVGSGA